MIRQWLFGIGTAASFVACVTGTTSLGSRGSPLRSIEADGSADAADAADADTDAGGRFWCAYSWLLIPTEHTCQYRFAYAREGFSDDLDPLSWDPRNVRLDLFMCEGCAPAMAFYRESSAECDAGHGWYYLRTADGGRSTDYALCPTTCEAVGLGVDARVSAFGYCPWVGDASLPSRP